jgi:hypothetical protein
MLSPGIDSRAGTHSRIILENPIIPGHAAKLCKHLHHQHP